MRNVFLDLDGTLTDPREGIVRCIQHALVTVGREPPPAGDLERFIGPPLGKTFRELLGTEEAPAIDAAISAYRSRFATVGIYENRLYPGIPAALEALRNAGRRLHLATVKPKPFALRIVDHFGLARHFAAVLAPELGERFPDKAALLRDGLEAGGIAPEHATMVGDRADDVVAARSNRVSAVAVTWGYGSVDELRAAGPDFVVGSVGELLGCLGID